MRQLRYALIMASLTVAAHVSAADCTLSEVPSIPNGAEADLDTMITAQKAVKAFQASAQSYRDCLQADIDAIRASAEEGDKAAAEAFKAATEAYNASVGYEQELADGFNKAIKDYKAANK